MPQRSKLQSGYSQNNWIWAYSSVITLLFMFFCLIYMIPTPELQANDPPEHIGDSFSELYNQLLEYKEINRLFSMELSGGEDYVLIRFPDTMLFEQGSARLRPTEIGIVDFVATALETAGGEAQAVIISGHTAEASELPGNVDRTLSAARANAVLIRLEEQGIAPDKLVEVAYGKNRPIDDNSTELGASRNQRVEILVSGKGQLEVS